GPIGQSFLMTPNDWGVELVEKLYEVALFRINKTKLRRDVTGDLRAMESAVLDEDLAGVHPRDQHAGQINACPLTLQRFRIQHGPPRFWIEVNAVAQQEIRVGVISGHRKDEVVLHADLALRRAQHHTLFLDPHDRRI